MERPPAHAAITHVDSAAGRHEARKEVSLNTITIAHLSDPHLPTEMVPPRVGERLNKRMFSYFSWKGRRRHLHRPEILAKVMADIATCPVSMIAVTGDLTNMGLPGNAGRHDAGWSRCLHRVQSFRGIMTPLCMTDGPRPWDCGSHGWAPCRFPSSGGWETWR